jgi:hypothetical protein
MNAYLNSVAAIATSLALVSPAFSQAPASIGGAALKSLALGKTWAIAISGDPDNPDLTQLWDFRADGSVCARAVGQLITEKCADEGKWSIRGDSICWELTWLGESSGYRSQCSLVMKLKADRFELRNEKTPTLRHAAFRVK